MFWVTKTKPEEPIIKSEGNRIWSKVAVIVFKAGTIKSREGAILSRVKKTPPLESRTKSRAEATQSSELGTMSKVSIITPEDTKTKSEAEGTQSKETLTRLRERIIRLMVDPTRPSED